MNTNKDYSAGVLCGFIWCHGNKDFSSWEVSLKQEDINKIEQILSKYDTKGSSLRNCYDSRFNEVFNECY